MKSNRALVDWANCDFEGVLLMTEHYNLVQGPHQGQPIPVAGEAIERAKATMVMVHGRGACAESILEPRP